MLTERLQVLISTDQRRRLEGEAKRRGTSVATLIREAVDAQYGGVTRQERLRAVQGIRRMRGSYLSPDALNRLVEQERDVSVQASAAPRGR
ncbi:MAG: hypothetical protein ACYDAG_05395 [Chloroflexota bacterium]